MMHYMGMRLQVCRLYLLLSKVERSEVIFFTTAALSIIK